MVKDLKRSIRDKYKRREAYLYYAIEQYLIHAEDRLNEQIAGKARDKEKIEQISQSCCNLLSEIPVPKEYQIDQNIDIEEFLGKNNTEEILKAGKEWLDNLSPDELVEIRSFNDKQSK